MKYPYNADEQCRENLKRLVEWYKEKTGNRNEATTRALLIDRLLFECLGWTKEDVAFEEYHSKEYTDYTFFAPRRMLIIEAKKEGEYFEVPFGADRLDYSIQSLMRDNPQLRAAVEQVSHYCQVRGVPFGAVCNGHQLVTFIATRNDGTAPLDGKSFVFPSLEFMYENFLTLWEILSKIGIEQRRLNIKLAGDKLPELPPKLSANILHYPGIKRRNVIQNELQILSDLIIEDVTKSRELEKDFLKECYCTGGALSQYSLISKSILQARYAALFESDERAPLTSPATTKSGISHDLLEESLSCRPILLIGDVGVGKTAFIRNLIKVEEPGIFEKSITLYLDFGTQATLSFDLKRFVVDEMREQLLRDYKIDVEERNLVHGIYHSELKRFEYGIYSDLREADNATFLKKRLEFLEERVSDRENHLKSAIEHLVKARKQQVIIFLDNSDQRDDSIQDQTFLIAQELASHWPVTVFVAIRPETFHRSVRAGALSGYHPKAFTIAPPRIDLVIEKRLRFALKITSGQIPLKSISTEMYMKTSKLDTVINVFLESLNHKDKVLAEFIDNISGGNVRKALDLVGMFFGSGHVNTEKIINIYEQSKRYLIPLHEFLRAIIYGDNEHYDPDSSFIVNLFGISHLDAKEHFLLPLIIAYLATAGKSGANESGFVDTDEAYSRFQGMGFTPEQIDIAIIRGFRKNLIETSAHRLPELGRGGPQAIRVTTVGVYHVERLCSMFSYFDAISVDTVFLDQEIRNAVHDVQDISARLNRAEYVIKYLDDKWTELKSFGTNFDWTRISENVKADMRSVREKNQEKIKKHRSLISSIFGTSHKR